MASVLFLLFVLSLVINVAQLINGRTLSQRIATMDDGAVRAAVDKCLRVTSAKYREILQSARRDQSGRLFNRAMGTADAIRAIRDEFPRD